MKVTYLVEIETESDTDILGIGVELKETLDQHFEFHTLEVKPWKRDAITASLPLGTPPERPVS